MYSYEIDKLLAEYNYVIPVQLYIKIISSSPQINHVKYDTFSNDFHIWTDDDKYWKIKVYNKPLE